MTSVDKNGEKFELYTLLMGMQNGIAHCRKKKKKSYKGGFNKGNKWYGSNRSMRYYEGVARIELYKKEFQ